MQLINFLWNELIISADQKSKNPKSSKKESKKVCVASGSGEILGRGRRKKSFWLAPYLPI
jgi:hypothetical protein